MKGYKPLNLIKMDEQHLVDYVKTITTIFTVYITKTKKKRTMTMSCKARIKRNSSQSDLGTSVGG